MPLCDILYLTSSVSRFVYKIDNFAAIRMCSKIAFSIRQSWTSLSFIFDILYQ